MLLILVSGGVLAQAPNVPPDHWAYGAVRSLLERGYLDAEAAGLFHGDNPVSRFDLAGVIAGLLDDIEAGRVQIGAAADVDMLRRLESEFRAELVAWHAARLELEEAHGQTQRQIAVFDMQLNNILSAFEAIDAELRDLEAATAVRDQRLDGHDAELAALQAAIDELYGFDGEVLPFVEQLDQRLDNLNAESALPFMRLDEMDAAMAEHWQDLQVLAALLERMQETDVTELRVIGSILNERIAALQDEVRAMQRDVAAVQEELDVLQGVMGTSEEQINVLTTRVQRELDDQLALSLAREQQLSRQLADLQVEFSNYRAKSQEELRSARNMTNIALGLAIVAVAMGLTQ